MRDIMLDYLGCKKEKRLEKERKREDYLRIEIPV
jgi:hypothetical protein